MQLAVPVRCAFYDLHPRLESFRDEVMAGLARQTGKVIPPKFFYDERGSKLFEKICALPEYYLTRAEFAIMARHATQMLDLLGEQCLLIEYGSGNSQKTRILLDRMRPAAYMPIDISREQLTRTAEALLDIYPGLPVVAICADYTAPLALPDCSAYQARRKTVFFPGSTIGNFTPEEASSFLRNAALLVGPGGGLLVGVDLKKDAATLHAAYNDASGVTAAFNLNLLARMNRELGADFDLDAFRHRVFYDERLGRIEMHLESLKVQRVRIADTTIRFASGETIHTENSYKYSVEEFQRLAAGAGFEPMAVWTGDQDLFSVHYLQVPE